MAVNMGVYTVLVSSLPNSALRRRGKQPQVELLLSAYAVIIWVKGGGTYEIQKYWRNSFDCNRDRLSAAESKPSAPFGSSLARGVYSLGIGGALSGRQWPAARLTVFRRSTGGSGPGFTLLQGTYSHSRRSYRLDCGADRSGCSWTDFPAGSAVYPVHSLYQAWLGIFEPLDTNSVGSIPHSAVNIGVGSHILGKTTRGSFFPFPFALSPTWFPETPLGRNDLPLFFQLIHNLIHFFAIKARILCHFPGTYRFVQLLEVLQHDFVGIHGPNLLFSLNVL